jgi:hypothetical protein
MSIEDKSVTPEVTEEWIRAALGSHGTAELTVRGSCMTPALIEGERVKLKEPAGTARFGDIVLIRTPGGLRLHRVLFRAGENVRTKGDHGTYLDPATPASRIIAVCAIDESSAVRMARTARSVLRLARRWSVGRGVRDEAHARLLP